MTEATAFEDRPCAGRIRQQDGLFQARPGKGPRVKAAEGRIRPEHGLFCGPDKARITPDPALRDRETHGNVCTLRKKSRKP